TALPAVRPSCAITRDFYPLAPPPRFGEGAGGERSSLPPAAALNLSPRPPSPKRGGGSMDAADAARLAGTFLPSIGYNEPGPDRSRGVIRLPSHLRYLLPVVLSGLVSFALCAALAVFLVQEQKSSAAALGENVAS